MKGRLGVYNKSLNNAECVKEQEVRLMQHGGNIQQERMIRDKRRSLDKATLYSYQGAKVLKEGAADDKVAYALINPNKLKPDYDDKVLSIGFEHGFQIGTIFNWVGTNTYWLIYLQDLTELAYFRGDIRKCSYQIKWEDEDGEHSTFAAVRGPVETKINFIQKHGISVDSPNHSLNIIMPQNDATLKYFERYQKFYLQDNPICWRVEATDNISTPGILEVIAVEYFSNEDEDDIEKGIVGGLLEKIDDSKEESQIVGETFIKMKKSYNFFFDGEDELDWRIDENIPVELTVNSNNLKEVSLKWIDSYSGQFDLYYGDYKKTIIVESLF